MISISRGGVVHLLASCPRPRGWVRAGGGRGAPRWGTRDSPYRSGNRQGPSLRYWFLLLATQVAVSFGSLPAPLTSSVIPRTQGSAIIPTSAPTSGRPAGGT